MLEEHGLLAHPHTSAGRVPTDSGYRYFVDRLLPATRPDRPRDRARADAPRGRRGDARDDRDAVAGDEPARDRLRAAAGDRDDPPHRGPAAAAADRDGRDHHLDRRRLQARADVRGARRHRPRRLGRRSSSTRSSPGSASARASCTRSSPTRRSATPSAAFLDRLLPAFTELADTAEDTLYVDGAARLLSEHRFQDLSQINAAHAHARGARRRCWRCCARRSTGATSSSASAPRTRLRRCARWRW